MTPRVTGLSGTVLVLCTGKCDPQVLHPLNPFEKLVRGRNISEIGCRGVGKIIIAHDRPHHKHRHLPQGDIVVRAVSRWRRLAAGSDGRFPQQVDRALDLLA
jgi:hypothetical protein